MRRNKLLFLSIAFFIYLISTNNAWANGWEHFTIPIENILRDLDSDSAEVRSRAGNQLGIRKEKIAIPKILDALSREGITTHERKAFYASLGVKRHQPLLLSLQMGRPRQNAAKCFA